MQETDIKVAIEVIKGEGRNITFTITDKVSGDAIDVSDPIELTYAGKANYSGVATFRKTNSDFDKTDAVTGVVIVNLSTTDLGNTGTLMTQLKIVFTAGTSVKKSKIIVLEIKDSIV